MLKQGYGWAADVSLRMIFDQIFSGTSGSGYPPHRAESQQKSRKMLAKISEKTHRPFAEILQQLPREVVQPALSYPGIFPLINPATLEEQALAEEITKRMI